MTWSRPRYGKSSCAGYLKNAKAAVCLIHSGRWKRIFPSHLPLQHHPPAHQVRSELAQGGRGWGPIAREEAAVVTPEHLHVFPRTVSTWSRSSEGERAHKTPPIRNRWRHTQQSRLLRAVTKLRIWQCVSSCCIAEPHLRDLPHNTSVRI